MMFKFDEEIRPWKCQSLKTDKRGWPHTLMVSRLRSVENELPQRWTQAMTRDAVSWIHLETVDEVLSL